MPEPETPKPPFWTSLEFLFMAGIVWCLLMTTLLVYNLISPLTVGIFALVTIPALIALIVFQFKERRKYPPPPEPTDPRLIKKSIRQKRYRIGLYTFYLIALFLTGSSGLYELLLFQVPASILLITLIVRHLKRIRRLQRKLKESTRPR